jgi:DNA replication protein DnaC
LKLTGGDLRHVSNVLNEEKKQQVVALGRLGWSLRRIQRATQIRRETAAGYLKAAGIPVRPPGGWGRGQAKPAIEVSTDPKGGNRPVETDPRPGRSPSASACEPYREIIEVALSKGRNAVAIWQDLVDGHGFPGRYSSVKRFVHKLCGSPTPEARVVIETAPGEEAQVDYGSGPMVRDPNTGKYRRMRLFVMTLGHSRKSVRLLVFRSSTQTWAELHEKAFRRLGGSRCTAISFKPAPSKTPLPSTRRIPMNLIELQRALTQLRLGGIAAVLETRLRQAQAESMPPIDLISCLVSDELTRRSDRLLDRRRKQAGFRDAQRTLDNFDFTFNPKMNRSLIFDLATGAFIGKREDALFLGPGGTGKSHLAQAIGQAAIQQGYRVLYRETHVLLDELADAVADGTRKEYMESVATVQLLIIDDFGMRKLPHTAAEDLLEIVMRRYERASTLLTSNRPVEDWGKLLGDVAAVSAMLDRLLHHGHVLKCGPRSWRTKTAPAS